MEQARSFNSFCPGNFHAVSAMEILWRGKNDEMRVDGSLIHRRPGYVST